MLSGYNNDVVYQGTTFHVQTEEGGRERPYVRTILFYQGNVVTSEEESYEALLQIDGLEERVRKMMKEQHQRVIRRLTGGEFQEQVAKFLPPLPARTVSTSRAAPVSRPAPAAKARKAPPPRPAAEERSLDELIQEYLDKSGKKNQ